MPQDEGGGVPPRLRGIARDQFAVLCSNPGCAAFRVILPAPSRPRVSSFVPQRADCCMICHEEGPNIATLCCGAAVHLNCMAKWLADAPQPSCIRSYLRTQLRMCARPSALKLIFLSSSAPRSAARPIPSYP